MEKYASYAEINRTLVTESTGSALIKAAATRTATDKTFLAHSTADASILPQVISILEENGANVYIDKTDSSLPQWTNPTTALILKSNISLSKRFVVLATPNSYKSSWVPWELGLADGVKSTEAVATFPVVASDTEGWPGREYYGIYHRIVWENDPRYLGWWVQPPNGSSIRLRTWLAGG